MCELFGISSNYPKLRARISMRFFCVAVKERTILKRGDSPGRRTVHSTLLTHL
jgi:hypothetical protein